MTQDERWLAKYNEVMDFMEKNKRNPSRYDDNERGLYCNWIKHNRQLMNTEELKGEGGGSTQKVPVFNERV